MKKAIFLFALTCLARIGFSQFSDGFSDGEFLTSPAWSGDISDFIVNPGFQLQLNGDCVSGGDNYLSSAVSTKDSASWVFFVQLGFDPSSSNYTKIYLQSDNSDLNGTLNGYFIKIGEDGTGDVVHLYRQDGTSSTAILNGTTNVSTAPVLRIKVIRTNAAQWQLYLDPTGGTTYNSEGNITDATYNGGDFIGVDCKYTSTRCSLFYFDDFFVSPLYTDIDPPVISSATVLSSSQLLVDFNEDVDLTSAQLNTHYSVDHSIGNPISAVRDATDNSKVTLTFLTDFPEATLLTLTVNNVKDLAGNTLTSGTTTFSYYTTQPYDIVIDEIMADPDPPVALPDVEYVELYNTTDLDVDLTGYTFTDGSTITDPFPAITLNAHAYLIVTDNSNAGLFELYGQVLEINNFPTLNNDGDNLQLFSNTGALIHSVHYTSSWYQNTLKSNGGYSLEMIDPNNPCQGETNWIASNSATGGTPGTINSVNASNPDNTAPYVTHAFPIAADSVIVYFDEAVNIYSLSASDFTIDNGIGNPSQVFADANNNEQIKLLLSSTLAAGTVYTVTVTNITDCSGNIIGEQNSARFGLPVPADSNDIVINEVLFNPVTNGVDYVELYNRSAKIIDVSKLIIAELDVSDSTNISESAPVSDQGYLFFPREYVLITSDIDGINNQYLPPSTDDFILNTNTPNYPDNEGIVVVFDQALDVIDELHYTDNWDFALLSVKDGVSLERVNYDFKTQDPSNWHSAAEDVHFGTPGYQNSDFGAITQQGSLSLQYTVFSPDGDGYHDLLLIDYTTPADGYVGTFKIYDAAGRLIKDLATNYLLSRDGFITWDGTTNDGTAAKIGIYILYAEFYDLNGNTEKHKLKLTLTRKS